MSLLYPEAGYDSLYGCYPLTQAGEDFRRIVQRQGPLELRRYSRKSACRMPDRTLTSVPNRFTQQRTAH